MTYNVFSGTLNPTHSHSRYFVSDWDPFAEDLGIESDCDTEEEIRRFAFVVLTVQHCSCIPKCTKSLVAACWSPFQSGGACSVPQTPPQLDRGGSL